MCSLQYDSIPEYAWQDYERIQGMQLKWSVHSVQKFAMLGIFHLRTFELCVSSQDNSKGSLLLSQLLVLLHYQIHNQSHQYASVELHH